ncbi:DUF4157 domain-containing protein [Nostoc calcicola FACHB-3891]|nr:DUF4157 domain-containing protein [Nostoc calcicola FACHB-3891]
MAQEVVGRLAEPGNSSSIQRQEMPQEEELQMKPLDISTLQRESAPEEEEEELQMKPLDISTLQRESVPEEEEEELQMKSLDTTTLQRESVPEEEEEELQMKPLDTSTLQRESAPEEEEEELQMKSLDTSTLQRESAPEEEEELQMKPMVQRQGGAGMAASPDLEASINQARGSGQPIADNIRGPMEQAFGADFSGVKVHTDSQSDELNQSIQARAFTTGQDVFFRQGEYNPGSRGGQELLAHELTHVVQQNGGMVERSLLSPAQQQPPIQKKESLTKATTSLTTALPSGQVVQRNVKIKGKKTKTYANFAAFKKSPSYQTLMLSLAERNFDEHRVEFHLKQLFSTDVEFENEQHFTEALIYDIENKSMSGEEHTLQEQYMTLYGWKKREAAKQSTTAPGEGEGEPETLKVYRTMKLDDWKELEGGNNAKLSGHLGDFKQAQNYLYRKSPEPKVLIEFTLHPGAERELFGSGIMAFPDVKGKTVPNLIKSTLIKEGMSDSFGKASTNEGTAPDKVGVKSEGGEAGFSLGIGGGTSAEVFMGLVADKKVIGRSEAE